MACFGSPRAECLYKIRETVYTGIFFKQSNGLQAMPLNIRDPRAASLARDLAARRGSTMTEAIITALEAEIARDRQTRPLSDRLMSIAEDLQAKATSSGRHVSRDEIDAFWGQ